MTNKTIIFLGDSITDNCEWNELLQISSAQNRGIAGDITNGVLNRLDSVIKANPNKLFLMIGVNDLGINRNQEDIVKDYDEILSVLTKSLPNTKIYVQSILPTNVKITKYIGDNKNIIALNKNIKLLSDKYHLSYIDLYSKMIDNDGNLNKDYTVDGLHLNGNGYLVWKDAIKDYL
jgi:lysophospholipase L1-like esterase